jgi:hypothetical protein
MAWLTKQFAKTDIERADNAIVVKRARRRSISGARSRARSFPDAGCATGDQHDFAGEIGIDGDHGFLPNGARVAEGGISAIM